MAKERRDYLEIGQEVINLLREDQMSINRLATELATGWDTIERCLKFLEKSGVAKKVIERPVTVYKLNHTVAVPDEFIKDINEILSKKGSRYLDFDEFVKGALKSSIRTEKSIKRH